MRRQAPILFLSVLLAGATGLIYQVVRRRTPTPILDRTVSDRARDRAR